jgi:hypothetical protein
MLYIQCLSC